MTHPRGDVTFQAQGQTWTLRYSINALCDLEQESGRSVVDIGKEMNGTDVSLLLLRLIVWAGLRDHHPDVDLRSAGDLITDAGATVVTGKVGEAFLGAFPQEAQTKPPRPRKGGRAGTGSTS